MDIRDNLRVFVKEKGFKQAAIAEKASLSPTKFSGILNKTRKIEANELFAICDAIGTNPETLRNFHANEKADI